MLVRSLKLSAREFQIIQGLFDDETKAETALRLHISPYTVHAHLDRLYRKLGVGSRCQVLVRVVAEYLALQSRCAARDGPAETPTVDFRFPV